MHNLGTTLVHLALAAVLLAIVLACAVFVIAAVVGILRSAMTGGMKLVWCVLVLVAPFIGSLLWFAIGRGQSPSRAPRSEA